MDNILKINNKSIATQYEWGQLILQLSDIFMRLTQIKKHIICIAHEIVVQDDITSEILVLPLIYGKKLPGQLPLWFDEVYRMQVAKSKEGPVYQAMTTATTKYTAKSRLRVLDTIEVPNYNSIMEKVKNG